MFRMGEFAMTEFTRRTLLAGSAAAATLSATPALPAAPASGQQSPGVYRYKIGSFELTALYDGTWFRKIDDKFVRNASGAEVDKALTDAFLQPGIVPTSFTALLVNTGTKLVLIDAGTGGQLGPATGLMPGALAAAGVDPKSIDTILISHFHPDHINGIKDKDGKKVFANAEIFVSAPEWAFWMDDARLSAAPDAARPAFLNVRRIFSDLAREVRRFEPGGEMVSGITSIPAYGHTPGHTAFAVASGNQSMLVLGDVTNHPWLFARHPDWQGVFDVDGAMAVETRKRMLDRAAADKMLVQGYHFPFPASGYIARSGQGYEVMPVMWQPM
jgi:glyoxylase-like metal-dependent hydrolase (beta-lactamase superfamily II)